MEHSAQMALSASLQKFISGSLKREQARRGRAGVGTAFFWRELQRFYISEKVTEQHVYL